jgi:DNA modification methylase
MHPGSVTLAGPRRRLGAYGTSAHRVAPVIHVGDCLPWLRSMPDQSVDHTITDPPYSRGLYSRTRTNKGRGVRKNGRPVARTELQEQTSAMQLAANSIGAIDDILEDVAAEILRITKRWIVVFSDQEMTHRWRAAMGAAYLRTGVWVKTDPMPQVSGDRPAQGFEPATIGHRAGRKRWNGGGRPATWIYGTAKGKARPNHPCPKPLALMEHIVRDFTDPGDLVLDPFAGAGTTGVAAIRLGRRFLGAEISEVYAAEAIGRLVIASESAKEAA